MKQTAQNTYIGGINRDKSKHLPNQDTMWDNKNFRVLTQEGDSSLALVNVIGNDVIPDGDYDPLNPAHSPEDFQLQAPYFHKIIGHGVIRNDIVLFTVSVGYELNGYPSASGIYLYKWDYSREVFLPRITLFEDNLNYVEGQGLRLKDKIDTVTRWETNYVQKVYWTDGSNNLRYINVSPDIGDDGLPLDGTTDADYTRVQSSDIEDFDIVQKMDLPKPTFEGYASGELYAGMLQFNYRFYNLYGGESMFGQAGDLIPIFTDNSTNGSLNIKGDIVDTNCKKTVKGSLVIDGENLKFDRVEVVSLWYPHLDGVPTINIIDIQKIPDNASTYTINFEDTGTDYLDSIDISEYRIIKNDYVAGTFDTKDDRMFMGNVKESYFDVDFDARAYRFNSTQDCLVYNEDRNYYSITPTGSWTFSGGGSGTGWSIPEDADCINDKNNLELDASTRNNPLVDYKFQSNGSTTGGSGVNVSYTFGSRYYSIDDGGIDGYSEFVYNSIDYLWQFGSRKGFQRDEIYRFGLVLFDGKGRQSFVHWIGDIRMPSIAELNFASTSGSNIRAQAVFPNFTVNNKPLLEDGVTEMAHQIVYVKRESKDRTVLSSGMFEAADNVSGTLFRKGYVSGDIPSKADSSVLVHYSPELDYNNVDLADTYLELSGNYEDTTYVGIRERDNGSHLATSIKRKTITPSTLANIFKTRIKTAQAININEHVYADSPGGIYGEATHLINNVYFASSVPLNAADITGVTVSTAANSLVCVLASSTANADSTANSYGLIRRQIKGYGGDTSVDRQQNQYIPAGAINGSSAIYGDTYVGVNDKLYSTLYRKWVTATERGSLLQITNQDENDGSTLNLLFPVETSVVLPLTSGSNMNRHGREDNAYLISDTDNSRTYFYEDKYSVKIEYDDYYLYNPVYSKLHTDKIFFPKPLDWQKQVHFDTRIRWSNPKLNGEERDSWLQFLANNLQDVDNRYGSLNQLVNFKNMLFAFQESGFCLLPVNERAVTSGTSGSAVSLGEGAVLPKHMNYGAGSTVVGIQNGNKVIQSLQAMYWIDVNKKKFYRYTGKTDSLSDVKGLSAYFAHIINDKTTFIGVYNNRYAEVMLTLPNTTLVFNEMIDKFQGWFTFEPERYIKTPVKLLTTPDSWKIWEQDIGDYGSWFGDVFYSKLSLIVNSTGSITKEFNNVQYLSESYNSQGEDNYYDTLNTIKGENDYQETDTISLLPYNNGDILYTGGLQIPATAPVNVKNLRRRERIWRTTIPREELVDANRDNPRLRDAYCKLTFEYFNADNFKFILHNMLSFFRDASKT